MNSVAIQKARRRPDRHAPPAIMGSRDKPGNDDQEKRELVIEASPQRRSEDQKRETAAPWRGAAGSYANLRGGNPEVSGTVGDAWSGDPRDRADRSTVATRGIPPTSGDSAPARPQARASPRGRRPRPRPCVGSPT